MPPRLSSAITCLALLLVPAPAPGGKPEAVTPEQALQRLREGNERFVADRPVEMPKYKALREKLKVKQRPFAVVLTCADSRVVPEVIFDQQLGALFVIRIAGNVTDEDVLGSVEYAVAQLKSSLVVVMGHTYCGAVEAVLDKAPAKGNLAELLKRVQPGKDLPADKAAALNVGIKNNVVFHVGELTKRSELLRDFVTSGRVRVVGAVYSLESGAVSWLPGAPVKK